MAEINFREVAWTECSCRVQTYYVRTLARQRKEAVAPDTGPLGPLETLQSVRQVLVCRPKGRTPEKPCKSKGR